MSNLKRCAVEGCGKWEFQRGVCKAHIALAGSVAPPSFCNDCGAKLAADSAFCNGCGAKIAAKPVVVVKEDKKFFAEPQIPANNSGLNPVMGGSEMTAEAREKAAKNALVSMGFEGYKPPPAVCTRCKDAVDLADLVNPFVEANGKYFHGKCFTCLQCNTPLQGQQSFLINGDFMCAEHKTAVMCHGCTLPIAKGEKLEALGHDYHPACFICVTCGIGLANQPYFSKDDQVYCKPDYKTKFPSEVAPVDLQLYICAGCKDWIKSAGGYTENEAGKFHPVCWETFKEKEQSRQLKSCCVCNHQIDTWVEVNGKFMHPGCWTCVNCKAVVTADTVVSKKGKFYCTPCHKDPFREV